MKNGSVEMDELMTAVHATGGQRAVALSRSIRERRSPARTRSLCRRPLAEVAKLAAANAALRAENQALTVSLQRLQENAVELGHDLKAPLVAITGYAEVLRSIGAHSIGTDDYHDLLEQITAGAERMRQLVDEVTEAMSGSDGRIDAEPIDLGLLAAEAAQECLDNSRADPGFAGLRVSVDPLPAAAVDPVMIRRVFDNLLGNAVKYSRPGQAAQIHVTGRPAARGWIHIDITDNGIGIPQGQHELVFARRYRAHPGAGHPGTGLGLHICRRIVEDHGGLIGAEPAETGGTRFWFTLPAAEASRPSRDVTPATSSDESATTRTLNWARST